MSSVLSPAWLPRAGSRWIPLTSTRGVCEQASCLSLLRSHRAHPHRGAAESRRGTRAARWVAALCITLSGVATADETLSTRAPTLPPIANPAPPTVRMRDQLAPLPEISDRAAEEKPCSQIVKIEIHKYAHALHATCTEGHVRSFTVALGRRPFGDKRRQGDLRTPEGHYRIVEPPRSSQFHVFMPLDYPSVVDADAALSRGDIEPDTYLKIVRAALRGRLPPQNTPLGGAIGIHGEGAEHQGWTATRNWTLGCIALSDRDAGFIAERVAVGTPVVIRP